MYIEGIQRVLYTKGTLGVYKVYVGGVLRGSHRVYTKGT